MVAAALIGSAVVGAAASSYGANKAGNAASDAAAIQGQSNTAALAQNQLQFEASQALQAKLASQAAGTQRAIAGMQIGEQRRQFAEVQRVLSPFITAGNQALTDLKPYQQAGADALVDQRELIGLNGAEAQQTAISGLANGVEMQALTQQGENAILQNASATGGLRGGNTQSALAQFRPAALSGLINSQYERLGGLTSLGVNTTQNIAQMGQSSAAMQASSAMTAAGQATQAYGNLANNLGSLSSQNASALQGINSNYSNNLQNLTLNAGAISAGGILGQGNAAQAQAAGISGSINGALGNYAMLKALKAF
jgi:hypothetical protein